MKRISYLPTTTLRSANFLALWVCGCCILCLSVANDLFPLERIVQVAQQRYGGNASAVVRDWSHVLDVFKSDSEQQKLGDVNDYFNRKIRFATDQEVWGVLDYWATPIEALMKGAGDCEDYAIAKYFSLKFLGVPVSKLRLTYVKARIGGPDSNITQAHMVLTYYSAPDAEPLVLDNLVSEIRPASRRPDLLPIFSFNSQGVFMTGSKEPQPGGGSRLSKWNDVIDKMKAEGFE
jgi:predicted transglutaminase-like cysteine proteinase